MVGQSKGWHQREGTIGWWSVLLLHGGVHRPHIKVGMRWRSRIRRVAVCDIHYIFHIYMDYCIKGRNRVRRASVADNHRYQFILQSPLPPQSVCLKPGVHTNDFAPIHRLRALKLGHASLATVFRPGQPIAADSPRESGVAGLKVSANHNRCRYWCVSKHQMAPWCIHISCLERVARSGSSRDSVRWTDATRLARDSSVGS